ncbi:hypothetical protein GNE54_15895 [Trichormus variabilis V5]|nr:hypothetical protein [Trichormus variabilis V5]
MRHDTIACDQISLIIVMIGDDLRSLIHVASIFRHPPPPREDHSHLLELSIV